MALSSLLGASSKCIIGGVAVDAVVREVHGIQADITEHPVESGSEVADHYRVRPKVLSIDGIISRVPIGVGFPGQSLVNSVTQIATGQDPVVTAWDEFEKYMNDAEQIQVITGKKYYPRMMIVDLSDPRNTNDWMTFSMVCREIQTAFTTSVEALVAQATDVATTTAQEAVSKGAQAAAEVRDESILLTLKELAQGFLLG
jgi:hypothetical protein